MPLAREKSRYRTPHTMHDQVAGPPAHSSCPRIGNRTAFSSPSTTSSITNWNTLMISHENHVHREATYYNWRKKYGGLIPSEMKRLRQSTRGRERQTEEDRG